MESPQNIKNIAAIQPSNFTSGYYSKKTKTLIQKNICSSMFIAALFMIAKIWKEPKCPSIDE